MTEKWSAVEELVSYCRKNLLIGIQIHAYHRELRMYGEFVLHHVLALQ